MFHMMSDNQHKTNMHIIDLNVVDFEKKKERNRISRKPLHNYIGLMLMDFSLTYLIYQYKINIHIQY